MIRIARMATPKILQSFEKPRKAGQIPTCAVPKGQYISPLSSSGQNFMQRSSSMPMMMTR